MKEDLGFWASIAGVVTGGFASLFGVWKHTHRRIDGAYAELGKKASQEEMNRQRDNISRLFEQQRQDKDEILRQAREDRDAVMDELRNTNELLSGINLGVVSRPTREEVERMIEKARPA